MRDVSKIQEYHADDFDIFICPGLYCAPIAMNSAFDTPARPAMPQVAALSLASRFWKCRAEDIYTEAMSSSQRADYFSRRARR